MAQSYLTGEELVRMFLTVPELKRQCAGHDQRKWGLLVKGLETQFGVAHDGWSLSISLWRILDYMANSSFEGSEDDEDVLFYYEINTRSREVESLFIRVTPTKVHQPGPQFPTAPAHH